MIAAVRVTSADVKYIIYRSVLIAFSGTFSDNCFDDWDGYMACTVNELKGCAPTLCYIITGRWWRCVVCSFQRAEDLTFKMVAGNKFDLLSSVLNAGRDLLAHKAGERVDDGQK